MPLRSEGLKINKKKSNGLYKCNVQYVSCRDGPSPPSSVDTVTSRRKDVNDETAGARVASGSIVTDCPLSNQDVV